VVRLSQIFRRDLVYSECNKIMEYGKINIEPWLGQSIQSSMLFFGDSEV